MARPNKIWFRKDIGWWMVTIGGQKLRLVEGRASKRLAEQKFHELKAVQVRPVEGDDARVADVIDKFLAWSKVHRSAETNRNFVWYGQKFSEHIGYINARELRPHHVTSWVDSHQWGQTTQRNARRSVHRAFAWAVEEGLVLSNPLKGMKCPAALVRQRVMTDQEFRSILKASRRDFKVLVFALRMTGCRPKEARTLTWAHVQPDRWVLSQHKTAHKTGKARVIYLVKPMQRLMQVLRRDAAAHQVVPDGNVFLNARGKSWTVNAMRLRMERLKRKLKLADDLCPYLARHAFGTAAILNGVDPLTVAELLGHNSLEMIRRVYCHLAGEHQHLNEAAERATKPLAASKPPPAGPNSTG
jgi:integrase